MCVDISAIRRETRHLQPHYYAEIRKATCMVTIPHTSVREQLRSSMCNRHNTQLYADANQHIYLVQQLFAVVLTDGSGRKEGQLMLELS